jgi:hypothetical protein
LEKIGVEKTWINDLERWKAWKIFVENCCICSCETTCTNHYDGPIRNIKQRLEHNYYTLFCRCIPMLCHLLATTTCGIMLSQNHFPEPNQHILDFPHPILLCRITYWAWPKSLTLLQLLFQGGVCTFCVHQYGFCACWVLTFIWELYYRAFHYFSVQASGF